MHLDAPDRLESSNEPSNTQTFGSEPEDILASVPEDAEDVIGVSIGKAQTHLKSAKTPGVEKTQALEESGDYFSDGPDIVEGTQNYTQPQAVEAGILTPSSSPKHGSTVDSTQDFPSPWRAGATQQSVQRNDLSRSFLRDSIATSRRRASSGSAIVAEGLRRLIPDFATLSKQTATQLRLPTSSIAWAASLDSRQRSSTSNEALPIINDEGSSTRKKDSRKHTSGKAASPNRRVSQLSQPESKRPPPIRRSTSDTSLFLRRQISTSTTSSGNQWDHVQEQVNSRMKAIRDTWQDSTFRMPKLPTINLNQFMPSLPLRDEVDTARPNPPNNAATINELTGDPGHNRTENVRIRPTERQNAAKMPQATISGSVKTSGHPILADALSKLEGDVLILGGYRGSVLRSAKPPHRQLWVPIKVGLNIRRVDLEVGLNADDEERMQESIIASGSLSHIGPVDICRRLLRKLRRCQNSYTGKLRVHDYGYDWRLSPHLLSRRLIAYLENLESNRRGTNNERGGAIVIAHSLGGLVTRHAVNLRPELFAGVLYAGVPQHCVNILGPFRNGDPVLLSSRVLTAQVNFTLRTSYVLLPESGRCFFNKETGERYDVEFFDPITWDCYRLSPCINPPLAPSLEKPKTLFESASNVVSSGISFLPNSIKRSSWLGFSEPTSDKHEPAESRTRRAPQTVKQEISKAAEIANPNQESLEPSMSDAAQSSSLNGAATACTIPRAAAVEYLDRTLREIKQFKQELSFKEDFQKTNRYPPAAVLYGNTVPTVYGAKVSSRDAIKRSDAYDNLAFATGDGVVLARAAMLPEGYKVVKNGLVKSDRGHVGLLGDLEGVGACLLAIMQGREKGIGLGEG
ncbi:MAG: hypothetical protein Q9227_003972 [Pyrenula ochraceoflavens]